MPLWFWLNIPAAVAVFSATVGIPLWLVLRQPGETREDARQPSAHTSKPPAPHVPQPRPQREREPQLTH